MEEQKSYTLSKNAKQAKTLTQQYTEDIKTATEAMKRTVRHRRLQVTRPRQYDYKRIF